MASGAAAESVRCDLRGQVCPATLIKSLQMLNAMKDGLRSSEKVLVILTDHRDATVTIPDAAASMGYDVDVAKEGSHYRITVSGRSLGTGM